MTKEVKLKIKKFIKFVAQWGTIIFGAIIAAKVIIDALNPSTSKTVEDATAVVEDVKAKVDIIEKEKDVIAEEHQQILDNKKDRDEKAEQFFPDL